MHKALTFIIVLLLSNLVYGQGADVFFKRINSNDGLSKNSVSAIIQDANDFIWIATTNGLNRFDGETFKVFKRNPSDTSSIPTNEIQSLYQSKSSDIWIGTQNSGVFKYISSKDQFVHYDYFSSIPERERHIYCIAEDKQQSLWFGTDAGLIRYKNGKFFPVKIAITSRVRDIQLKSDGELWIVSTEGLGIFNINTGEYNRFDTKFPALVNSGVRFIKPFAGNWLIGTGRGAFVYSENTINEIDALKNTVVNCLAVDLKQNIWIGTQSGLFRFDKNFSSFTLFVNEINDPNSLSSNSITSLLINRTGILFVGTSFSGINICNTNHTNFSGFKFQKQDYTGSGVNNIKAIMTDNKGGFILGSAVAGLYHTNCLSKPCEKTFSVLKGGLSVLSAYHAKNDSYWIGSVNSKKGILNIDRAGKELYDMSDFFSKRFGLSNVAGSCFLETGKDNIWIGTNSDGLFRVFFDKETKVPARIIRYTTGGAENRTISSNEILCIQIEEDNKLWIGTKNGLNLLDLSTGKIKKIFYNPKDNYSIGSNKINNIFRDVDGRVWVGTAGGGVNLFLKDSSGIFRFKRFTETQGLSDNIVLGIVQDNHRDFWVSTSYGLNRISSKDFKITNYYREDGLSNNEFRHNAFLKDSSGILYFGTISGISYFDPTKVVDDEYPAAVKITDFLLFNKPVDIGKQVNGRVLLDSGLSNKSEIILKYDENTFGFRFAALHFASPRYNRFKYRLKGFSNDWIETGATERSVTFAKLLSGRYEFEIMASNHYNKWSEPVSVRIAIKPAPWNTWWAYLIYFAFLAALAWGIYKIVMERSAYRKQLAYEKNQQEIINEVNRSKLRFFTNISHDFRTPLTLILSPLSKIIKEEKPNTAYNKIHKVMYRNADRLYRLIGELMNFKELESGNVSFNPEYSDIVSWVKNVCTSYDEFFNDRQIHFVFHSTHSEIFMQFDKQKVENIIFNLLSNAANFTDNGGRIEVNITGMDDYIAIDVIDNGKVIPETEQKNIFTRYYTADTGNYSFQKGVGIGLALTRELVLLHEGDISVASTDEIGTCFTIKLPKKHSGAYKYNPKNELIESAAETSSKIPETKAYAPAEKPIVVIVEDNYDLREFLMDSLKDKYKVYGAKDGKSGLELIEELLPDLVISDIMMPKVSGLNLCHRLKSNSLTAHIPVILLTAKATVSDNITGTKTGADEYIYKPFELELLLAKSHNLIMTRRRLRDVWSAKMSQPDPQQEEDKNTVHDEFIEKAISLIEENLSEPEIGIDFLAKNLNVSRAQLYRKFKALSNQTVKEFIRIVRIRNAARLILERKLNISEICYEVGFTSPSYFAKCFKEIYGVTPTEYTEKNK